MSVSSWLDVKGGSMKKVVGICILSLVGVVVLGIALGFTGLGSRYIMAPFRGIVEQQEITNRGQYRIQAYEKFYRIIEQRESVKRKLDGYPLDNLDVRQSAECRGLLARYFDMTSEYNAASRAELTQGKWQDDELPQTLSIDITRRSC